MDFSLKNKTAIVCGASQGIGKSTALKFAKLGASLILISRNELNLKKVLKNLKTEDHQKHDYLVCDFQNTDELKKKVKLLTSKYSIDILINNSGGPKSGPIHSAQPKEFINAFNQHLICNHILVQGVLDNMINKKFGRIINIISTSVKEPINNLGVSNTIRSAVANWAKTLSKEIGKYNITVNNILPGATNTDRLSSIIKSRSYMTGNLFETEKKNIIDKIPMNRIGHPEEISDGIAFLASTSASYINGINLVIDGGRMSSF